MKDSGRASVPISGRSSIINHQSSIINSPSLQSSIINHQFPIPSIINHQFPIPSFINSPSLHSSIINSLFASIINSLFRVWAPVGEVLSPRRKIGTPRAHATHRRTACSRNGRSGTRKSPFFPRVQTRRQPRLLSRNHQSRATDRCCCILLVLSRSSIFSSRDLLE